MTDDAVQRRRNVRPKGRQFRRVFFHDGDHRVRGGIALESALAAQHFVEHGAECEEVGARVNSLAAHLFRRHVADGAHHRAWVSDGCHGFGGAAARDGRSREAKVENLDVPVFA